MWIRIRWIRIRNTWCCAVIEYRAVAGHHVVYILVMRGGT
jgi:hypothetical protein